MRDKKLAKFERIFDSYNEKIDVVLDRLKNKNSYSYRQRKRKVFSDYSSFSLEHYQKINAGNLVSSFVHFRDFTFRQQTKEVSSINDDMRALRRLLRTLISARALPRVHLPPNLKVSKELLRNIEVNPVLGALNPKKWESDLAKKSLPLIQNIDDKDYLSVFIEHVRSNRNLLLKIARNYVANAYKRFTNGEGFIASADSSIFDDPDLLDRSQEHKRGQTPSLFSDKLADNQGLKNLVSYLHFKHNGMLSRQFPGANNHLYRFEGRTSLSEYLGISSDLAAACAIIIVIETGVNAESLYKLKIKDSRNNVTFYLTSDENDNAFIFTYDKPRAKRRIQKFIKSESQKINAEFCFLYLLDATLHHRTLIEPDKANLLFIHDSTSKQGEVHPVSATAFKQGFHRVIQNALSKAESEDNEEEIDNLTTLISTQPNLAKLRKTEGVLKWFDSGGDPRAAALYLGNTTKVAIKNYLPFELQVMLYTKHIRAFQHILIKVATDSTSYQQQALGLKNHEELSEYLEQLKEQDLNWSILGENINNDQAAQEQTTYIVVLTESNIALLYAAYSAQNSILSDGQQPLDKLTKWASVATSLFNKIKASGTRGQKLIIKKGIDLYNRTPAGFKV